MNEVFEPDDLDLTPRRSWITKAILGVFAALVLLFVGMLAVTPFVTNGRVARFHGLLDAGASRELVADATESMRQVADRNGQVSQVFDAVHAKLGAMKSTARQAYSARFTGEGFVVSARYETTFARGAGTESFVWIFQRGALRLNNYFIRSDQL
jgi:hypothetical protein